MRIPLLTLTCSLSFGSIAIASTVTPVPTITSETMESVNPLIHDRIQSGADYFAGGGSSGSRGGGEPELNEALENLGQLPKLAFGAMDRIGEVLESAPLMPRRSAILRADAASLLKDEKIRVLDRCIDQTGQRVPVIQASDAPITCVSTGMFRDPKGLESALADVAITRLGLRQMLGPEDVILWSRSTRATSVRWEDGKPISTFDRYRMFYRFAPASGAPTGLPRCRIASDNEEVSAFVPTDSLPAARSIDWRRSTSGSLSAKIVSFDEATAFVFCAGEP